MEESPRFEVITSSHTWAEACVVDNLQYENEVIAHFARRFQAVEYADWMNHRERLRKRILR